MDDGGWALSKNVVAQIETQAQSRSLPGSGRPITGDGLNPRQAGYSQESRNADFRSIDASGGGRPRARSWMEPKPHAAGKGLRGQFRIHDLPERMQRLMPLHGLLIWQQRKQLAGGHQEMPRCAAQGNRLLRHVRAKVPAEGGPPAAKSEQASRPRRKSG